MASREEILQLISGLLNKGKDWRFKSMEGAHQALENPNFLEHVGGTYPLENLSPEAYDDIARYTGPAYTHVNAAFRDLPKEATIDPATGRVGLPEGAVPNAMFYQDPMRATELSKWAKQIERGYNLADVMAPTTSPEVVFRGVANPRNLEEGQRVVSMAPMSTSLLPRVATEFSENYGGVPDPKRTLALYLPQGTLARHISQESEQAHEAETLLPPHQEWRVAFRPTPDELNKVHYGYALEHMGAIDPQDLAQVYEDVKSGKLKYIAGAGATAPIADFVQSSPTEKEGQERAGDLVRRYTDNQTVQAQDEARLASIPADVRSQFLDSSVTPRDLAARDALISAREDARLRDLPNTNPVTYKLYQKAGLTPDQIAAIDPVRQFASDASMLVPGASAPATAVNALDASDTAGNIWDWASRLWR